MNEVSPPNIKVNKTATQEEYYTIPCEKKGFGDAFLMNKGLTFISETEDPADTQQRQPTNPLILLLQMFFFVKV